MSASNISKRKLQLLDDNLLKDLSVWDYFCKRLEVVYIFGKKYQLGLQVLSWTTLQCNDFKRIFRKRFKHVVRMKWVTLWHCRFLRQTIAWWKCKTWSLQSYLMPYLTLFLFHLNTSSSNIYSNPHSSHHNTCYIHTRYSPVTKIGFSTLFGFVGSLIHYYISLFSFIVFCLFYICGFMVTLSSVLILKSMFLIAFFSSLISFFLLYLFNINWF